MPLPLRSLKEVVYTLSNYNQNVMQGLWKDISYKTTKRIKENWVDNLFLIVPVVGAYTRAPAHPPAAGPELFVPWGPSCCPHQRRLSKPRGVPPRLHRHHGRGAWPARSSRWLKRPPLGACRYATNYKEQEKLHHRY